MALTAGLTITRRVPVLRRLGAGIAAVLLGVVSGCAGTPQAVLHVPLTYTADMCQYPLQGGNSMDGGTGCLPTVSVVVCLDEVSAVHVTTTADFASLEWNGVEHPPPSTSLKEFTTPVLQPGCGRLEFGYLYRLYHYATVTAEKV